MTTVDIVNALEATLDAARREHAEKHLSEIQKLNGFLPRLLEIVMTESSAISTRQTGVVFFKNTVIKYWEDKDETTSDPTTFVVAADDKQFIRERIVEAMIEAPEPIRVQLKTAIEYMIKYDYPTKWSDLPNRLHTYLSSTDHTKWTGTLLALHALVKRYEPKANQNPPDSTTVALGTLLPLAQQRLLSLMGDDSEYSVGLQKIILKTFYHLTQVFLPLTIITKPIFSQWMDILCQILLRDVPASTLEVDEDERGQLIWWKCKKWAMHIIARMFERYGSPGNVMKQYQEFSQWYLKSFSGGTIITLLKICEQYRMKTYVSPRVMQQLLSYFTTAVLHAFSWKVLKPHIHLILQEVVFPLLCFSEHDLELWQSDPIEYVREKSDILEELISPRSAALNLLIDSCTKRKEVLQRTVEFIMHHLRGNASDSNPRQFDGAFFMIGTLSETLLKREVYKDQMEIFITNMVFPLFTNTNGFLRARACWLLSQFSKTKFKNNDVRRQCIEYARQRMCEDAELPVKVSAATSIQAMLADGDEEVTTACKEILAPHLDGIIKELLKMLRETENDDLNTVLQDLVHSFKDKVADIAFDMTNHLAQTFIQILTAVNNDAGDHQADKAELAFGILNTIETILGATEDIEPVIAQLETIVVQIVAAVLTQNVLDFFEEILSMVCSLTSAKISMTMWQVLHLMYDSFDKGGQDYFTDMMPALHNYVTVDPAAFLSNPKHMEMMFNMAKKVLNDTSSDEDPSCHAAKLLEVILINYRGQIDVVVPTFVEVAIERLTKPIVTSELRTMCLQVVIAALYYNPQSVLDILLKHNMPNTDTPILQAFLHQWLTDTDCFLGLHDRKMSVLGLCILLTIPSDQRPAFLASSTKELLPNILLLFEGLKQAYAAAAAEKAAADKDSDSELDDEDDDDNVELESDEDKADPDGVEYLEKINKSNGGGGDDSDEDDDDDDDEEFEAPLESYETTLDKEDCPVDEYMIFRETMERLQSGDPAWYQALVSVLNTSQQEQLQDTLTLAVKRKQLKESKEIEKQGGYKFNGTTPVPSSFDFGGKCLSPQ